MKHFKVIACIILRGNKILTAQLEINGVDMGCALWGMHSACETGGVFDHEATAKVFAAFFA